LTGERLIWYRVASHLHLPVDELKERITYTEFLEWIEYLGWDERRQTKLDFYLAQIATEVRRSLVKHPNSVKVKDFLLGQKESQDRTEKSKRAWTKALNVDIGKN